MDKRVIDGNYKKVSDLVHDWVELHKDERFDLDMICRDLRINERGNRKNVAIALNRLTAQEVLEKNNNYNKSIYRFINTNVKYIDWVNAPEGDVLNIGWPYGIEDNSRFGFDGRVRQRPGRFSPRTRGNWTFPAA